MFPKDAEHRAASISADKKSYIPSYKLAGVDARLFYFKIKA
jgi:hypothetical protein